MPKIAWDQTFGTVASISWTKGALLDVGIEGSNVDLAGTLHFNNRRFERAMEVHRRLLPVIADRRGRRRRGAN